MVAKQVGNKTLVSARQPFAKLQLLLIVGVVAVAGTAMISRIFAASGSITILPATANVNIGNNVTVTIRENSSTDPVNGIQANVTYDATKLQYVSVDDTGSAFGIAAETAASGGVLKIARGTSGGAPAVTGDQLVTTVTFKALAAGSVPLTIGTGSALVRSTDAVDILAVRNNATLTLADTAAPSVPTGLVSSQVTMTSAVLTWTAATDNVGVAGYRVFRNGVQVATTTSPTYSNTGLAPGTSYTFSVAAYDAAGNVSAQTTGVAVTTLPDTVAPSVPGTPTSPTQTMTSITIAWAAATDNVAVTSYRVYRCGTQIATVNAPVLTYTNTGLQPNTAYCYTVAAVDAAGNVSAQSAAVSTRTLADTQAPTVPLGLTGSVTGANVALSWTAATDNVGVTAYVIYRDGTQIATSALNSYIVTGAPVGAQAYTVAAQDAAGNTSAQSTALPITIYQIGDINRDGSVNVFDLSTLLSNWSNTGVNTSDLNGDSVVNVFDLSILLARWTG